MQYEMVLTREDNGEKFTYEEVAAAFDVLPSIVGTGATETQLNAGPQPYFALEIKYYGETVLRLEGARLTMAQDAAVVITEMLGRANVFAFR